ncbi:MAG: DUF350 domain-containing protein [Gammaproteobacteria bacterium]|uniref:DUF350 domain-containing protein n=1 Tax=Rheinheimera sp. BAL341 TaxID=1708203 RepID=A0A486XPY3_9GAMM|nr:DUF350 domain-containing protein [Gammaproteobacteria bacterium]
MDISFISASFINLLLSVSFTVVALFVSVFALLVIDKVLLKRIDIQAELAKNNLAVAIFASAIMLFVALIICFGLKN